MATPQTRVKTPGANKQSWFDGYITGLVGKLDGLTKSTRQWRYYQWSANELMSKGVHLFAYDSAGGTFREWDDEDQDLYTPFPYTEMVSGILQSEYSKSNPKIIPNIDSEDRKAQGVKGDLQKAADSIYERFWRQHPEERQREAALVVTRDLVWSFLERNQKGGRKIVVPNLQGQDQEQSGSSFCLECGSEGPEEMPECQKCGSTSVMGVPGSSMTSLANQGNESYQQGEWVRRIIDPFQVEVLHRVAQFKESPYLIFDDIEFKGRLAGEYDHVKIDNFNFNLMSGNVTGLHYKIGLENVIGNTGQFNQNRGRAMHWGGLADMSDLMAYRRRVWLDPCLYEAQRCEQESELPGMDKAIPKGARLGDVLGDGMLTHFLNATPVKYEDQHKGDYWDCYRYSTPASGFYGTGISSVTSLNKGLDEVMSYRLQHLLAAALGIFITDPRLKGITAQPGRVYSPQDMLVPGEDIRKLAAHIAPAAVGSEPANLAQTLTEGIIQISGARNVSASGVDPGSMNTATAQRRAEGTQNAIIAPKTEQFAAHVARVTGQVIALEKKLGTLPRYYSKFGETHGIWLDPLDIPDDVSFSVDPDSHQPKTLADRRDDTGSAINLGWGTQNISPEAQEQIASVFQMPKGEDDYENWSTKGEKRLDAMKMLAPQIMAMPVPPQEPQVDPETGEAVPPPDPEAQQTLALIQAAKAMPDVMDSHPMMIRYWLSIYVTDEYDELPPVVQKAIGSLFELHQNAILVQQSQAQQKKMVSEAPMREQIAGEQEQNAGAQRSADAQNAVTQHGMHEEAAQAQHGRQMEAAGVQHQHAVEIEKLKGRQQKELANSKPKK